jgi:hypothetical protein
MRHRPFRELLTFFEELEAARSDGVSWQRRRQSPSVVTGVGFLLYRPPLLNLPISATPTNSRAFASAGLDGSHFNFLLLDGEVREDAPVVMTCPRGAPDNVVVGEDLLDFLCLGVGTGYAAVQELCDEPKRFTKRYPPPGQFAPWVKAKERRLLRRLAQHFGLTAWTGVKDKLERLAETYLPLLRHAREHLSFEETHVICYWDEPGTPEEVGRKPMRYRMLRGGVFLGTITEELSRNCSNGLGLCYFVGRLTPSPAFAGLAPLFQELRNLSAEDEAGCGRVHRAILQPGLQMQDTESGEVYNVQDIGIDGDQVSWTPFVMGLPSDEGPPTAAEP